MKPCPRKEANHWGDNAATWLKLDKQLRALIGSKKLLELVEAEMEVRNILRKRDNPGNTEWKKIFKIHWLIWKNKNWRGYASVVVDHKRSFRNGGPDVLYNIRLTTGEENAKKYANDHEDEREDFDDENADFSTRLPSPDKQENLFLQKGEPRWKKKRS